MSSSDNVDLRRDYLSVSSSEAPASFGAVECLLQLKVFSNSGKSSTKSRTILMRCAVAKYFVHSRLVYQRILSDNIFGANCLFPARGCQKRAASDVVVQPSMKVEILKLLET
jgi:hypothetical protein